jgi:hypothetical protein
MVRPSNLKKQEVSVGGGGRSGEDALDVVHSSNGSVGTSLLGEAHEAEATATTGVAIFDDDLGWAVSAGTRGGWRVGGSVGEGLTASST